MNAPSAPRYHVIQGDVHEILVQLARMGVGPFDALFCDPPYGLTDNTRKGDRNSLARALLDVVLPDLEQLNPELIERRDLSGIPVHCADLRWPEIVAR